MQHLTKDQIEQLYTFTRQHFVYHYDLQTELVDHLGNGIEQQWLLDPDLSFERARDKEFKKFGVFGFMDVIEKRQKAMNKRYSRMVWKHFVEYMKLPKVLGFIGCVLLLFCILKFTSFSEVFFLGSIFSLLLVYVVMIIKGKKRINKEFKDDGKNWMLKEIILNQGSMGGAVALLPIHFYNIAGISHFTDLHELWFLFISLLLCSLFLFMYIMSIEIPKLAEDYLRQTYPEYGMVS